MSRALVRKTVLERSQHFGGRISVWERSDADLPNPLFTCKVNGHLDGRDFHSRRGVFPGG